MSTPEEMNRLVIRAKTEQFRTNAEKAGLAEEQRRLRAEFEEQRTRRLKTVFGLWLVEMGQAEPAFPGAQVIKVSTPKDNVRRGWLSKLLGPEQSEHSVVEYAGWMIHSTYSSRPTASNANTRDTFLLADGSIALVRMTAHEGSRPWPLTEGGEFVDDPLPQFDDRGFVYIRALMEKEILSNLQKIASENGIEWSLPEDYGA